jgi:ribonuclease R
MQTRVGILQQNDRNGLVVLDQPDPLLGREIFVAAHDLNGAPFGMKVVCALLQTVTTPSARLPRGKIVEVLGDPNRPDVAILSIIRQNGLPDHFPAKVLNEASEFASDPDPEMILAEIRRGRRDLRGMPTLTMDGEDAKDLDDAISLEVLLDDRYRLGVHIADVSHYVTEHSELDKEARRRGTSVYLVDRVIPMLPPRLSNGICSLNPDHDRLTLSVFLTIGPDGETEAGEIVETVIHSQARTSYREVTELLEQRIEPVDRYPGFLEDLRQMRRLAERLTERRLRRGSLEFEFPETHVDLDQNGRPLAIYPYPITFANGIIEEFMIAANEYIARQYYFQKMPFLYRVHELPDKDKLQRFIRLAGIFGVRIRLRGTPAPGILAKALDTVRHEPYGQTLAQLLLRSLAKARYSDENLGHFGLAAEYYCHFTSPIRRYPDLYIHRIIKASLHGTVNHRRWQAEAAEIADHSSAMERLAMQAERDTVDQKAAEYLSEHLGESFDGVISGFNQAGIYIRLESTVEGMVPYRSMDGYITYEEETLRAVHKGSGQIYSLGDAVTVQVARVDTIRRQIDFELLGHQGRTAGKNPVKRGAKNENKPGRTGKAGRVRLSGSGKKRRAGKKIK